MLFSSLPFAAFFVIYLALHRILPDWTRIYLVILGSTFFYGWWKPEYVWLPYLLSVIAYAGTHWLDKVEGKHRRNRLALVIAVLFAPLLIFKYSDFVYLNIAGPLTGNWNKIFEIALPLGISFMTFTLLAYVVDVERGIYRRESSFIRLLGYVLFFPHLIAGPILRPHELLPQFANWRAHLRSDTVFALSLISIGLFKKLVIADGIAPFVDSVYAAGSNPSGWQAILAVYAFSLQIYCDFSGYSDMAVGLALLLGIRLPANFNAPYAASTIVEFWRRWHITLSLWLRDYLYIPLGGNRVPHFQQTINILITMGLGGLWHGASWTFVIWGAIHGLALAFVHMVSRLAKGRNILPRFIGWFVTFHFVSLAWIFFRAPDIATAYRIMAAAANPSIETFDIRVGAYPLLITCLFLALHRFDNYPQFRSALQRFPLPIVWPFLILLWVLAIAVSQGSSAKFIYFDF